MKVTAVDVSFCQTNVDYNKVKADILKKTYEKVEE